MADITVNFPKVPIKTAGLEMVVPPELSFKLDVTLDKKIRKAAEKDPLLIQEFTNQAKDILDQTTKTIEQKCKVFDKMIVGMVNKGAPEAKVKAQLKGLNEAIKNDMKIAEKAAEMGVAKTWKELQAKRKEWKGFKIKIAVSVVGNLAGLAVSLAGIAMSGFSGGASAVLGVAGFIKSGVTMIQDIKKMAISIEGARKELTGHLVVIERAARNTGVYNANEVSAAVFNELIGISQPSVKSARDCADTLKAKYAQLVVKVHDTSKTLQKALKAQEKIGPDFMKEAKEKLKKHPTTSKASEEAKIKKKIDAVTAEIGKKIQALIEKIMSMYEDTRKWAPTIKTLVARVDAVELKDNAGLKAFRELLKLAGTASSIIDGNAIAKGADLALGLGGAAGGYVYDKIASKVLDGTVLDAA